MEEKVDSSNKTKYQCYECQRGFKQIEELSDHVRKCNMILEKSVNVPNLEKEVLDNDQDIANGNKEESGINEKVDEEKEAEKEVVVEKEIDTEDEIIVPDESVKIDEVILKDITVRGHIKTIDGNDKEENSLENISVVLEDFTLICGKCGNQFEGREKFDAHQETSSKCLEFYSILKCKKCSVQFDDQASLKKHTEEEHIILKVYACAMCDHKTTVHDGLRNHVVAKHLSVKVNIQNMKVMPTSTVANVQNIKCDQCDYECRLNIQLRKHCMLKHCQQFKCDKCDYKCVNKTDIEEDMRKHMEIQHPVISSNCFPCNECDLQTQHIDELVEHKKTVHGVLRYACDLCEHVDNVLEGLWRHKIDAHQAYVADTPEATYNMQQMLLISLSAQVEFMVTALTKMSAETSQVLKENKTQMDKLENNMGQIDSKVQDLGVALAKTSRFDTRIQNDSQAVLTKVSEKCVQIENLVLNTVAKGKESIISKKEAMGNR